MIDSFTFTDRVKQPLLLKLFPLWWFYNSKDPMPPYGFLAGKATWYRVLAWYIRNPLANFMCYVIGVEDRNYTVIGTPAVLKIGDGQYGWGWTLIKMPPLIWLPFTAYESDHIKFYLGWLPYGHFGMKVVFKGS